ncbi:MAG: SDR family NAD(P)-dependent oxidoreductase [Promethearchaeota archaeon]
MNYIIQRGINWIIDNCIDLRIKWKKQTVLITGGSGFLGSWIADVLVQKGSRVIIIDNLSSGLRKNIQHLEELENFSFLEHDVSKSLPIDESISYVFHLASRASPFEFAKFPIEILKANTLGILNTLEIARLQKAKFLYTSTSEIYGNPEDRYIPTPETYNGNVNPIGPRSCYDEAKRAGEAFVMAYILEHNLDARIVRIFNTYGPRMRSGNLYGRVIPNFIEQCLQNKPLTVFGDGHQTRAFAYVTDTIEGILRAAFLTQTKGEVFNIGNIDEISIISLARKIINILNNNARISYGSLPIDDPKRRCADISKAQQILRWTPKCSLDKGLEEFKNWFMIENGYDFPDKDL